LSKRGAQLLDAAEGQINELIGLLSRPGEADLSLPCPGREKLGDGTVAALALHTTDSYLRIAGLLQATSQIPAGQPRRHPIPRPVSSGDYPSHRHVNGGHDVDRHYGDYTAENVDLHNLLERLSTGRDNLNLLADMTDQQLDTTPPAGSFRFCDGQRTLEQVISALLNHQRHQIDAIEAAII
jgi:hypothetical protein